MTRTGEASHGASSTRLLRLAGSRDRRVRGVCVRSTSLEALSRPQTNEQARVGVVHRAAPARVSETNWGTYRVRVVQRNGFARPWPEGQPTRPGERCPMSDLLVTECACKKHRGEPKESTEAEPVDLDFS